MAPRILITGASGNIGREIVIRLKERQVDFIAASRQEASFTPEVKQLFFDYSESALTEQACRDIDALFLLVPVVPQMKDYARRVIEAARRSGVKFILLNSILGADPESNYLLHRTHGEIDQLLELSGVPWAIIHPNTFMQGFSSRHLSSIRQGALFLPESEARSSFVDTRDVADVAVDILLNPEPHIGKHYDITGPEALTNEEALSQIAKIVGRRIAYVPVTEGAARHRMMREGEDPWVVEAILSLHRAAREGVTSEISSHYQDLRGRDPRRFKDFCSEMASFWEAEARGLLRDSEL